MTELRHGHSHPRRTFRATLMGVLVIGALALPHTSAYAQSSDLQIMLDRMERLERDIRTLNRQIARTQAVGEAAAPDATSAVAPTTTPAPTRAAAPAPQIEYTEGEGALARVTVRMSALEQEVRQATGQAEGMNYRLDQISVRLDKLISDLDYRLSRLEGSNYSSLSTNSMAANSMPAYPTVTAAPSTTSVSKVGEMAAPTALATEQGTIGENGTYIPPKSGGGTLGSLSKSKLDQFVPANGTSMDGAEQTAATPDQMTAAAPMAQPGMAQTNMPQPGMGQAAMPTPATEAPAQEAVQPAVASVLPEGTPRERYQFAFGLMSQARYGDAEAALKEFIERHGEDALAGNAWYWLGETYYVRKSFMEAAQTFFQAYKKAPEGAKAPDSLLKLGMSMASLEKTEEACTTFGKLRKEFASLKPSIERTLNRETKRLKCK